ncbi:MAG: YitT family protein [Deltaproteobacteria bacterium]|nr:YitT family protein [Deltaproteobacteria bacterium]
MTSKRRASLKTAKRIPLNLFLMALGSALCALSINGILVPKGFYGAGLTGIALLIHYAVPALSVALIYLILNIPIFAMGWVYVGKRFFLYSLAGMFIFTAAVKWIHVPIPVEDPILSALFAGILMGTGTGIILKSQGSAGGLDVLSVILLKRFSIRLGSTILVFNLGVLTAGAILFSLELALFTLIYLYVNARMVNLMVTGLSQRKAVHIISPHWEAISKGVMHDMRRGVTIIEGQGAYSKKPEKILYIVITFRELAELKRIIHRYDPNAFMVVSDTLEVMGLRIGNQPHW